MDLRSGIRVTHESWGSRLKGAVAGVLVGLLLFLAAFPLLIFNEGRAVRRARSLGEAAAIVVSIDADRLDASREGALVHVTGAVAAAGQLADPEFGVAADAIRLRRRVEMYQWRETRESEEEEQLGGGTETVTRYDYERVWSTGRIDSDDFEVPEGHHNPAVMLYEGREWQATPVRLGAFELTASQVERMSDWAPVTVPTDVPLPAGLEGNGRVFDGGFYVGDPADPRIGDLRIGFAAVYPGELTVVARQQGARLAPYPTATGGEIELVDVGTLTATEMFESAQAANTVLTWVLRAVGFLLLFLGITMMLKPLSVVADVVPLVGNLVEAGTGVVALLFAGFFATVTIALGWLVYRPVLGLGLLAIAGVLIWLVRGRLRARSLPGRKGATA